MLAGLRFGIVSVRNRVDNYRLVCVIIALYVSHMEGKKGKFPRNLKIEKLVSDHFGSEFFMATRFH